MSWEMFTAFAIAAALCWVSGAVLAFVSRKTWPAATVSLLGTAVLLVFIVGMWVTLRRPPMRTMGETRLWYSFFLSAIGIVIFLSWRYKWVLSFSTLMSVVFLCNMEVKVDSPDPKNTPGEIITKGPNMMVGYYKNEQATADTIDEDGWLHTGDLAVMDKDGFFYIRGRKKNMLLGANGQNIYPEEAEDQVVSHSVFEECVVVQREGKLVALVYISDMLLQKLGTTREELDLEAIRRDVNLHLPSYCQLSKLEQRNEEFEKTPKKSIRRFLYK